MTYRTVAALLAEVALIKETLDLLGLTQFADARIHALGHVLVFGVLWLGHVEQLECKLAHAIWGPADDSSALALNAAGAAVVDSPFVEAGNVDSERPAVCLAFVVVQANIGTSKGAVRSN